MYQNELFLLILTNSHFARKEIFALYLIRNFYLKIFVAKRARKYHSRPGKKIVLCTLLHILSNDLENRGNPVFDFRFKY